MTARSSSACYTAVGKGCQDIIFFLIEGYTIEECRRLEPIAMKHYHAALLSYGVKDYSFDDLKRDWKLAAMHFPFYVAMWFGTTSDEDLVLSLSLPPPLALLP